jgi:hypothetical protein
MEFLDEKRLGKQRVEACQILEILLDQSFLPSHLNTVVPFDPKFGPWLRHPAVLMWRGFEEWLKLYLACAIGEWCSRGYANTIAVPSYDTPSQKPPSFLGLESFHLSHRCNLIRKSPAHYLKFWPKDRDDNLPYYWPSDHNAV